MLEMPERLNEHLLKKVFMRRGPLMTWVMIELKLSESVSQASSVEDKPKAIV